MRVLFLVLAIQILNAKSDTACKMRGYSYGFFKDGVQCVDSKGPLEDFIVGKAWVPVARDAGSLTIYMPTKYHITERDLED